MRLFPIALVLIAGPTAFADTFGGFSGVDRPYLVNQDRACMPVVVQNGAAAGAPSCQKATADVLAHLDIKTPVAQSGSKATFAASASGRTITVSRIGGDAIVTWDAPDPIGKVIDVFASGGEDRIAVTYSVRRAGRDMTDVVAFDLLPRGAVIGKVVPNGTPDGPTVPTVAPPPADPVLTKAVDAARKAPAAKAAAAWQAVLAIDADHSEAHYRLAVIAGSAKKPADALAQLTTLAASSRPDAIEFLVDARFDKAFAGLRADARFRAATGLDRKASTVYERVMGLGGQWEQGGTPCDKAEVRLVAQRDRTFKLRVKTACEGQVFDLPFHGIWRVAADGIILSLPTNGKAATEADDAPCKLEHSGDEDALHCVVGKDLDFVVLPTRR